MTVDMFADGACKGNPGPGGWGVLLRVQRAEGPYEKEIAGGDPATTNNRMELTAAIRGLAALSKPCAVTLHTDSRYVIDGITKWVFGWQKNGWVNAKKDPVANADLWRELIAVARPHQVTWQWVKGHSGHAENERVDKLASDAATAAGVSRKVFNGV